MIKQATKKVTFHGLFSRLDDVARSCVEIHERLLLLKECNDRWRCALEITPSFLASHERVKGIIR